MLKKGCRKVAFLFVFRIFATLNTDYEQRRGFTFATE